LTRKCPPFSPPNTPPPSPFPYPAHPTNTNPQNRWWNPAAEWQSADRCHRIGQKRPCVITRLCIEDSVESRMVMLQEKKANMINGTINNDQVAMEKLTPEDMQFLFRGS